MINGIKVLIVDDSMVSRNLLSRIFSGDPGIIIAGMASSGEEAIRMIESCKPDIITMDISMPGLDGFQTTQKILQDHPIPVLIISGNYDSSEAIKSFKALEAGAVAILPKPKGPGSAGFDQEAHKLCRTLKSMSEVKVVRRKYITNLDTISVQLPERIPETSQDLSLRRKIEIIAIGASAGGPDALGEILSGLKGSLSVPLVLVQHIDPGFAAAFAEWLGNRTGVTVKVATDGEILLPGTVYTPPGDRHIIVGPNHRIRITQDEAPKGLRPSVSLMLRSVNQVYGQQALGVILSGMGKDGAQELKQMRDNGCVTIVQDEITSLVFGMPGEAFRIGAATHVLPVSKIAEKIIKYLTQKP